VWDTAADNWSPAGALYADGLNVIFDDSGNASSPILIPSPVAPNTVTVNTTNNAYTLTAGLSGNAMLAKRGPAALTLEGAHTHAGATIVEDGTLHLAGSLAASSVTIGKDAVLQQAAGSVIDGAEVSLTVQGKAWLRGANTYGGETVAGVAGQYDHDTTVCHDLALGSTAGGTTVVGGHAQYHNRVILASGVTVTGERLTLSAGGRVALAYTNDSGSATWDGDIVTAPGSLAYLNSNRSGGTLIVGAPGTGATITGAADIQFREAGAIVCNSRIDMPGLSVIRNNNGVLRLNSTNNVMRQFQIAEGTLRLGADNQLPADVILSMGKGDANTGNKAYLDLNGHSLTIGGFVETHYDAFTGVDIVRQCVTSALPATFIVGG
jgi:autotransporter-associated beta strand protein